MVQNYNFNLSFRQKSLLEKLRKAETRLENRINDGSFSKMSRKTHGFADSLASLCAAVAALGYLALTYLNNLPLKKKT